MATLPLQDKILRETNLTVGLLGKQSQYKDGASEQYSAYVNKERRAWEISYMPLSFSNYSTIFSFLNSVKCSERFLYTDGCNGGTYSVRRIKDSLEITRKKGQYIVRFSIHDSL